MKTALCFQRAKQEFHSTFEAAYVAEKIGKHLRKSTLWPYGICFNISLALGGHEGASVWLQIIWGSFWKTKTPNMFILHNSRNPARRD